MINLLSPFSPASEKTGRQLFREFSFGKWFALGFSAWLASFVGTVTGFSFNYQEPDKFNFSIGDASFLEWGLPIWIAIVLGLAVVVWLFAMLIGWLGCRGQFMFLDNVLHNRSDVTAPWRNFRQQGNSLFLVYASLWSAIFVLGVGFLVFAVVTLRPDILAGRTQEWRHYMPLIITGGLLLVAFVSASILWLFMRDFGSLWMYLHGVSGWEAFRKVNTLATEEPVSFIVYLLVRMGMGLVFATIAVILGCMTCCVGFVPYISTVIMLPISVFLIWYNAHCFAQFGPEYDVVPEELPPALPPTTPGLIG